MKEKKLQNKIRNKFIKKGVKMIAPETVFFSNDTKIGKKVVIEPYVVISKCKNWKQCNYFIIFTPGRSKNR